MKILILQMVVGQIQLHPKGHGFGQIQHFPSVMEIELILENK
jgi:hypothetical protein